MNQHAVLNPGLHDRQVTCKVQAGQDDGRGAKNQRIAEGKQNKPEGRVTFSLLVPDPIGNPHPAFDGKHADTEKHTENQAFIKHGAAPS